MYSTFIENCPQGKEMHLLVHTNPADRMNESDEHSL